MKKRLSLNDKAFIALKEAVKEVMDRHAESGRPAPVWRDGKLVYLKIKKKRKKK